MKAISSAWKTITDGSDDCPRKNSESAHKTDINNAMNNIIALFVCGRDAENRTRVSRTRSVYTTTVLHPVSFFVVATALQPYFRDRHMCRVDSRHSIASLAACGRHRNRTCDLTRVKRAL